MKTIMLLYLTIVTSSLYAQKNICGAYYDYFGRELIINVDSTFHYSYAVDLYHSWTKGIWRLNRNVIYFTVVPVFDTMSFKDEKTNIRYDSLILSSDEKAERRSDDPWAMLAMTSSGGQNDEKIPQKLCLRRNGLYSRYAHGLLKRRKVYGISRDKKYPAWYIRKSDN